MIRSIRISYFFYFIEKKKRKIQDFPSGDGNKLEISSKKRELAICLTLKYFIYLKEFLIGFKFKHYIKRTAY